MHIRTPHSTKSDSKRASGEETQEETLGPIHQEGGT